MAMFLKEKIKCTHAIGFLFWSSPTLHNEPDENGNCPSSARLGLHRKSFYIINHIGLGHLILFTKAHQIRTSAVGSQKLVLAPCYNEKLSIMSLLNIKLSLLEQKLCNANDPRAQTENQEISRACEIIAGGNIKSRASC